MANEFKIRKGLEVNGDTAITGDLSVSGQISGNLSTDGDVQVGEDLHVVGDADVDGNANVDGNAVIHGDLQVDGSFSFAGGSVFPDDSFEVQDNVDATKTMGMSLGGASTSTKSTLIFSQTANRNITFPDASTAVVGHDTVQTLSNKKLIDNVSTIIASGDATKAVKFDASGITTSTTRTISIPDADLTMVGTDTAQTLTNKTIDADANSISNIDDGNIKSGAAIARSKIASGTAAHVVINDGSGVLSSEATLSNFRGGFGADVSGFTGVVKASAGAFSAAALVDADVDAAAAIARSKLASGTPNAVVINNGSGVLTDEASLDETRGGTAQTGYAAGDTLYASGTDVLAKRTIGNPGQISKVSNSALPAWEDAVDPTREVRMYEDWIADSAGALRWLTANNAGAGAVETTQGSLVDANHPGILQFATGTTTTGRSGRTLGGAASAAATTGFKVGGGIISQEWLVRIEDLATVGEDYALFVGNADNVAAQTDGIYFFYQRSVSTNWSAVTRAASTSTTTDTGVAAAEDAWIKLRIEVNAAGTSVAFYINGSLVATNTTNIPSAFIAPMIRVTKSAGTTSRLFYCDYFKHYQRFSSTR